MGLAKGLFKFHVGVQKKIIHFVLGLAKGLANLYKKNIAARKKKHPLTASKLPSLI